MMKIWRRNKEKGFTLIELLIVVAIIAILADIAVPNFLEAQIRAQLAHTATGMRTVANAQEAYLSEAELAGANLEQANRAAANLERANLEGANLRGANLAGADLSGANLSFADLSFAQVIGIDLTNADLTNANLILAQLTSVIWNNTTCPDGTNSDLADGDGFQCSLINF